MVNIGLRPRQKGEFCVVLVESRRFHLTRREGCMAKAANIYACFLNTTNERANECTESDAVCVC